jgi:hypothetical protein
MIVGIMNNGRAIPVQALKCLEGSRRYKLQDFKSQHMKVVRLLALHTSSLYASGNIPGFHYFKVWPEGLLQ